MSAPQAFAPQVCTNCKVRKKKCSKHLPSCELCSKLLLHCQYGPQSPGSDSTSSPAVDLQPFTHLLAALSESPEEHARGRPVTLAGDITSQVLSVLIANRLNVPSIIHTYFQSIHVWLPILSKEKCLVRIETLTTDPAAELAVLLLSMALIIQTPINGHEVSSMQTPIYFQTKALHLALVSSSKSLIEVVQAGLLISLYEQGHGMVETARITMATCSRLAIKLNVQNRRLRMPHIEDSEFGRTWWGLVILDRFMNLGIPPDEIHLVADSQILRSIRMDLPNDDEESQETMSPFPQTPSGIAVRPPTTALGPFCRTAQAAHLLGQTLEVVVQSSVDGNFDNVMWVTIDRALQALAMGLLQQAINGWEECCAAIGLCLSSLLTLHEVRWQVGLISRDGNDPRRDDEYEAATLAIRSAIRIAVDITKRFLADIAFIDLPSLPLPATFAVYFSAFLHIQLAGSEIFEPEWHADFQYLKGALSHFARRWDIGKRYLDRLDIAVADAKRARGGSYGYK